MKQFSLPEKFIFGTATASLQIEGGDKNNTWYRWSETPGKIKDGTSTLIADDHWNRVDEDIRLMKKMHVNGYRMSLEWSRIEPRKGEFNLSAINHYKDEIIKLKKAGIEPLVTLHHFSNPLWFEDSGGWTHRNSIEHFQSYVEFTSAQLGSLVKDWVTINEPNVYLHFGYLNGIWPPGENNLFRFISGAKNMIASHIAAYKIIHKVRFQLGLKDTKVASAHHLRIFDPKHGTRAEKFISKIYDRLFQDIFVTGMSEGKLLFPLGRGYPWGKGCYQDYFGINYYSRDILSFNIKNPAGMFGSIEVKSGAPVNDLGWEIYPEGLYRICEKYFARFRKPIYITENGTCDKNDLFRTQYIYDHMIQIKKLIDNKINVERYYHWTLMDNFEWAEGLTARFGLIEVDFANQKRKIRKSGNFYTELCKNHGVTADMIKKYFVKNK